MPIVYLSLGVLLTLIPQILFSMFYVYIPLSLQFTEAEIAWNAELQKRQIAAGNGNTLAAYDLILTTLLALDLESVPRHLPHLLLSRCLYHWLLLFEYGFHRLFENPHSFRDLLISDNKWRHKPQSICAASNDEQSSLPCRCDHWSGIYVHLQAQNQSLSSNLVDSLREPLSQVLKMTPEGLLFGQNRGL